jgi:hypothetical protein
MCGVFSMCGRDEKFIKTSGLKNEETDNLEYLGVGRIYNGSRLL